MLRGRIDDARRTLAKLRLRTPDEAKEDPLIQVYFFLFPVNLKLKCRSLSYWRCKSTLLSFNVGRIQKTDSRGKHGEDFLTASTLDGRLLAL